MRLVLALALVLGCSDDPGPSGPAVDSHVNFFELPGYIPRGVDLLVVVDNTSAMAPYQSQLAGVAAVAETELLGVDGAQPDFRLAVTTTEGTGALRTSAATSDLFLAQTFDVHFRPTPNHTGTFADALGPMLAVGTASSAPTKPLQAAKAALDANPTFRRADTSFALIVLTVGDDASSDPVASYVSAFRAGLDDPTDFLFSASYDPPATRLDAFAALLPNRAYVEDITTSDLSETFLVFNVLIKTVLGAPCVRVPLDVDPDTAGDQYECDVNAFYEDDTTEVFRQCKDGMTESCYEFEPTPAACPEPGYASFRLRNFPSRYRPSIRGQCVVEGSE